ncbi:MAG: tetratricopeptide repeat protein [Campylobacteraceae bacterium]|jgi:tetratricopeptide (TPR) repeat protein|nr:tetratricopeptide repeat protein [Campylobacteraceae bacterium]
MSKRVIYALIALVFTLFSLSGCTDKKRPDIVTGVLLVATTVPTIVEDYAKKKSSASQFYNTGVAHYKNGRYGEAVESFKKAIEIDGHNAEYYVQLTLTYKEWGHSERALNSAMKACELGKCKMLEELAGSKAFELGEKAVHYDDKIQYYTVAIKENPKNAQAYYKRGLAKVGIYYKESAIIQDFTQAIKLEPNFVNAYLMRAKTYVKTKEYEKALADFTEAIKIKPNEARFYYERANFYDETGEHGKANEDFVQAVKLEPGTAEAYYNRALLYISRDSHYSRNDIRAIEICNEMVKLYPNDPKVYYYRGVLYSSMGNYYDYYDKALADFTQTVKLDPTYAEAYYRRAWIVDEKNEPPCMVGGADSKAGCQQLIADYTQAIKFNPNLTEAYIRRAEVYETMDDYESAAKDYTEAIRIEPNNAEHYLARAKVYWRINNLNDELEDVLKRENEINDIMTACKLGECEELRNMERHGTLDAFMKAKAKEK